MNLVKLGGIIATLLLLSGCSSIQKEPLQAASLAIHGIQFLLSPSVPESIPVSAVGTGSNEQEATTNALVAAMQDAVGVLIVSESSVSGNRLTSEIISQYSSAMVSQYKVRSCSGTTRIRCEVDAIVTPWNFYRSLQESANGTEVDGKSLYAQHLTIKHGLEQRKRITDYFFSNIRTHGLEAVLLESRVEPSQSRDVSLYIRYRVRYKKDFWNSLEDFLQRLERDTGGQTDWNGRRQNPQSSVNPMTAYIQWGPTGLLENRVYIHTFDESFYSMIEDYRLRIPILVSIPELNFCDRIELGDSYKKGFFGDIFQIDWHRQTREHRIRVQPEQLEGVTELTLKMGC